MSYTLMHLIWMIVIFSLFSCSLGKIYEVIALYNSDTNTLNYNDVTYVVNNPSTTLLMVGGTTEENAQIGMATFWFNVLMVIALTLFAGIMSGLTVGYLSIDDLVMELKLSTGTDEEKQFANNIIPVISNHHWLLVTLLLCNSFAMEAMPIFLARIVNEMLAIVISVTLVLFFGEIIPQALCTGPNQLKIASFLAKPTIFLMYVTYPISYPLSLLIDHVVGKHMKSRFANSDLRGLIELHTVDALNKIKEEEEDFEIGANTGLSKEQANAMLGALDIQEKKAKDIMIPLDKVVMLEYNTEIDEQTLSMILNKGFSRIPVYSGKRNNVVGILRIKQLINVDIKDNRSLKDKNIQLSQPIVISPEMFAIDLLNEFRKGKSHMAFITKDVEKMQKQFGLNKENSYHESLYLSHLQGQTEKGNNLNLLGIVTLEDVIENLIKVDILDEDDYKKNKAKMNKAKQGRERLKKQLTKKVCESFINEKKEQINSLINPDSLDININDGYILLDNKIKY